MKIFRMKYRKNRIRKSTKYTLLTISVLLMFFSAFNLLKIMISNNVQTHTREIYEYNNKFKYNYNVNTLPNKYGKYLMYDDSNRAYATDLIDNTDFEFNYAYKGDKISDLYANYKIIGKMQSMYEKDGKEQKILEEETILKEDTLIKEEADSLDIKEKINVDLKEMNELLIDFKQKTGIPLNSTYTITLKVEVDTVIENKNVTAKYESSVLMDLAEKTTRITGDNNKEETQYISAEMVKSSKNTFIIIISYIGLIITIILLKFISNAKVTTKIKNNYRRELNRILRICQDKTIKINSIPEMEEKSVITVKDISEIVKLSEELFKPILYYHDEENEKSHFFVMTNTMSYTYIY